MEDNCILYQNPFANYIFNDIYYKPTCNNIHDILHIPQYLEKYFLIWIYLNSVPNKITLVIK